MKLFLRSENKSDYKAIHLVLKEAFSRANEALLVEKLRLKPKFLTELSIVTEFNDKLVGYALFYPIKIINNRIQITTLSLAPVSVIPKYQNLNIGTKLVKFGLRKAKKLGFKSVVVIGHPNYYPRFGFKKASSWGIKCSFPVPEDAFLALELEKGSLEGIKDYLKFPKEFNVE